MATCVFLLPIFTGFTSLKLGFKAKYRPSVSPVNVAITAGSKILGYSIDERVNDSVLLNFQPSLNLLLFQPELPPISIV